MKKFLFYSFVLAGVVMSVTGGYRWWRSAAEKQSHRSSLSEARSALASNKPVQALALLARTPSEKSMPEQKSLEVQALTKALRADRLTEIWENEPERVVHDEEASLLIYRRLLSRDREGDEAKAHDLRDAWTSKTKISAQWTLAAVDSLMAKSKGPEARQVLEKESAWPSELMVERHLRLSLLLAPEDIGAAWKELNAAAQLAPNNPALRSFRGQILEVQGKIKEARVEYVAALVADPNSVLQRDQLASFYQRQGDFDHAITTWLERQGERQTDFLDVKGYFWAHVISPSLLTSKVPPRPTGKGIWNEALDAIELAPQGKWLSAASDKLSPALREFGELWWLQCLDVFQSGDLVKAEEILATQPAKAYALAPELTVALKTLLALRVDKPLGTLVWPKVAEGSVRPSFFAALQGVCEDARTGRESPDKAALVALISHPGAVSYAFAAAGWREAALRLHDWEKATEAPESIRYTIAMCLRLNRSPKAAAAWLRGSKGALLNGLAGECLIASGETESGLSCLENASKENSDAGRRAGWLLTLAQLEMNKLEDAEKTLLSTPGLKATAQGHELAAKLALAHGDTAKTTQQYADAVKLGSIEGRTWLLRQAVSAGDTTAAIEASMDLREALPDELLTRKNQLHLSPASVSK